MPRKSPELALDELRKQKAEIERQQKQIEREIKEKERTRRSTMLVAYGLLVMDELNSGKRNQGEVDQNLDRILKQNSHRAAVGLPLIGIAGKSTKASDEDTPLNNEPQPAKKASKGERKQDEQHPDANANRSNVSPMTKRVRGRKDGTLLPEYEQKN